MLSRNIKTTICKSVCAIAMGLISINDEYKQEHYSKSVTTTAWVWLLETVGCLVFYDATDLMNIFLGHYIFCGVQRHGSFKSTDFLLICLMFPTHIDCYSLWACFIHNIFSAFPLVSQARLMLSQTKMHVWAEISWNTSGLLFCVMMHTSMHIYKSNWNA